MTYPSEMYRPAPISDTAPIDALQEVQELVERLAENAHDIWSAGRIAEGWTYGPRRDESAKKTPNLVPYADLPEQEKEVDRRVVSGTLKALFALGFRLSRTM